MKTKNIKETRIWHVTCGQRRDGPVNMELAFRETSSCLVIGETYPRPAEERGKQTHLGLIW